MSRELKLSPFFHITICTCIQSGQPGQVRADYQLATKNSKTQLKNKRSVIKNEILYILWGTRMAQRAGVMGKHWSQVGYSQPSCLEE